MKNLQKIQADKKVKVLVAKEIKSIKGGEKDQIFYVDLLDWS